MKHYQLKPTEATCPVCDASEADILWSVNSKQAAQHYVLQEVAPEKFLQLVSQIESLWQQSTCDIVRCKQCGFCYSHPYVAGDGEFYSLAYERSHYPTWKWEHQLTYDALSKGSKNFKLLELGAGDGAFVKQVAPSLTAKENLLCTEYSDYGRTQIQNYGIQCLPKDVREAEFEQFQGQFDAVCLFQVIEHMDRLDELFQRLNLITQPNANLFISVPNPNHVEFSELNGGLMDMPPNHIGRWNRGCFETIGDRWGWSVESYEVEKTGFIPNATIFAKYRFWRESQKAGSFANRVSQMNNPAIQKMMRAAGVGMYALTSLPALAALNSPNLGLSQWLHLRKTASLNGSEISSI